MSRYLRSIAACGVAWLLIPSPSSGQTTLEACPLPEAFTAGTTGPISHVRYLSDDILEGRAVASWGERCAAEYLADRFAEYGLLPGAPDGTFFQTWDVRIGTDLGPGNRLAVNSTSAELGTQWLPYGFSASSEVDGSLVGVPETGDAGGAAHSLAGMVLVLDGRSADPHATPLDPHQVASSAGRMGVAGVVVLTSELPDLTAERRAALPVPVIAVQGALADDIARGAGDRVPVRLAVDVMPLRREATNVVARIEGSNPSDSEALVIGAHFDHLGRGAEGSLSPNDMGEVHNGADDNASGTAVLLEVGRRLAQGAPVTRDVILVGFSGEERGLWGSARFVEEPSVPVEQMAAMLNMDMVGRVQDNKLTVFGTGTAEEWTQLLEQTNSDIDQPLTLQFVSDGYGASDHSSFYAKGIPVLHFFSGTHAEYHRVEDDWHLINAEGLVQVADLVTGVARGLMPGEAFASLTAIEGAGNPHGVPSGEPEEGQSVRTGFRVRLGTIPDYSFEEGGMRITGVRDASPASKGGLQGGDVIIRFGDHDIEDVYGYMYALQEFSPGDEVEIVVIRDGEEMSVTVVLEAGS